MHKLMIRLSFGCSVFLRYTGWFDADYLARQVRMIKHEWDKATLHITPNYRIESIGGNMYNLLELSNRAQDVWTVIGEMEIVEGTDAMHHKVPYWYAMGK